MALINCPECKKEVSNQAKECNGCGYPLSGIAVAKTAKPEMINCKKCNAEIKRGLEVCPECKKPFPLISKKNLYKPTFLEKFSMPFIFYFGVIFFGLFNNTLGEILAVILSFFLIYSSFSDDIYGSNTYLWRVYYFITGGIVFFPIVIVTIKKII
ncbi:MAG: zinc ribbon domain-containing protein [Sulfurimonas sp.]|nr:zinc ribbon domain-containing protein [Sulfurimonas sp.]MDD3835545.1 zinc ribbon domain-containing protein [Sulfurimonas sp.]